MRRIWNDTKDLITARDDAEREAAVENIHAREVLEALALRQGARATEARNYADRVIPTVGWWKENSKEAYSSGFEAAATAFKNYFASKSGTRNGTPVGWPKPKARYRGRASVSFTTGAIGIVDRHHVQLPVIGVRRTKEPTDKLRLKLKDESAKILRATLSQEGGERFVSFNVIVKRKPSMPATCGVSGTDVGIAHLATSSDGHVVENPRAEKQLRQTISRYQRRMDRQHRTNSPACFNADGTRRRSLPLESTLEAVEADPGQAQACSREGCEHAEGPDPQGVAPSSQHLQRERGRRPERVRHDAERSKQAGVQPGSGRLGPR
jgi:hypothetical protein